MTDPDGRRVALTFAAWRHVCREHPELAPFRERIMATIPAPTRRMPGRRPNEEWFYGHGFGPTGFVKIVVHYDGRVDAIVTAFPRRRVP
jgi:hypothetical protein